MDPRNRQGCVAVSRGYELNDSEGPPLYAFAFPRPGLGLHGVRRLRQRDRTRKTNPKRTGLQRRGTFSDGGVRGPPIGPHIVDQRLDDLLHGRHLAVCDADEEEVEEEECKNTPRHS